MSHHSDKTPLTYLGGDGGARNLMDQLSAKRRIEREFQKLGQLEKELGPTGDHPAGRLVPHDEGGLIFGVTVFQGRVILDFGKPIRSIGFTRNDALELAEILRQRAKQCPPIIGVPGEIP